MKKLFYIVVIFVLMACRLYAQTDTLKKYYSQSGDTIYTEVKKIKHSQTKKIIIVHFKCADSSGVKFHNGGGCGGNAIYSLEQKTDSGWVEKNNFVGFPVCALGIFGTYYVNSGSFEIYCPYDFGTFRIKVVRTENISRGNCGGMHSVIISACDMLWYTNEFEIKK